MGDVVPFGKPQKKKPGNLLCKRGHHKWKLLYAKKFDTRQGKFVSHHQCARCGKQKIEDAVQS